MKRNNKVGARTSTKRRMFTPEEDEILRKSVAVKGMKTWNEIAKQLPERTARQCRDRYFNYLSPRIVQTPWDRQEDELLVKKVSEIGTHWSMIANFFPTRSDNNLKNRWHSVIKLLVKTKPNGELYLPAIKSGQQKKIMHELRLKANKKQNHTNKKNITPAVSIRPHVHPNQLSVKREDHSEEKKEENQTKADFWDQHLMGKFNQGFDMMRGHPLLFNEDEFMYLFSSQM